MSQFVPEKEQPQIVEQVRWAIEHGGLQNKLGQRLVDLVDHGIIDPVVEQLVRDQLRPLLRRHAAGQLPPFRAARLATGEILLGQDFYGSAIHLQSQWLTEHVQVLARSGGGKSTLLVPLLLQIALGRPVWMGDFYKKELRRLRALFRACGVNLIVLRAQDWRWNLLQSNLRDPRIHLARVVELLVRVLGLPPRAATILRQVIHELYQRFGLWDGNTAAYPTLFDVYAEVQARRQLNAPAREAILDRLGAFLVALTPKCGAWRVGWLPDELAKHTIDFECQGAPESVKQMLVESTIYGVFLREVEKGVINEPLRLFIAFEDAQKFLSQGVGTDLCSIPELLGVVRGCGIGMAIITQTSIGLPRPLIPNLAIRLFGVLGSAEDWQLAMEAGLTSEQVSWAKLHLPPRGMFIGIVSSGGYREPFLFRPKLIPLPAFDGSDPAETLKPLEHLKTVPAEEFRHWEPYTTVTVETSSGAAPPRLSETELRFLRAIVTEPGKGSSCYAKASGVSGKRAAEVRSKLTECGLIREHRLATSPRGRTSIILEPLQPALELCGGAS